MIVAHRAHEALDLLAPRLKGEPPGFLEDRARLRGDHSFDPPGSTFRSTDRPKIAAVLVPIVSRADGPTLLLTERASGLRNHGGQIALPGGRVDPDDASPIAAALREAEEEIGLDRGWCRPLGYLDAYLSGTGYFVLPVVASITPDFELRLNPSEVASAFEVPLSFLLDEENHELHVRELRGRIRQYYAMPFGHRYIWGVTAGILRNMYEKLSAP